MTTQELSLAPGAPVPNEELVQLLRQANASLEHLKERAMAVVALDDPVSMGFCPRQLQGLCRIIDRGRAGIQRQLADIVDAALAEDEQSASNPPFGSMDPVSFLAKYRACCRVLCQGLNEALRNCNGRAGAVLSDLVLRLEKQLWLMDTPQPSAGSDRHRSVALFLTC